MEQKGGRRADELPGPVVCRSGSVSFGARLSVYEPFSRDNMDKTDKNRIQNASRLKEGVRDRSPNGQKSKGLLASLTVLLGTQWV